MEAFFVHLLKSSGILLLFFTVYLLFLKKETFFNHNRAYLLTGLLMALSLPWITFKKIIVITPQLQQHKNLLQGVAPVEATGNQFNWVLLTSIVYFVGVLYFLFRIIKQFKSVYRLRKRSEIEKDVLFTHVKTKQPITPFSFFTNVFYYPLQFSNEELTTIIAHEKAHVAGKHSIDILLTEIITVLLWFNPLIWMYKILVKQNLEFIADAKVCEGMENKKTYQYLMLKHTIEKETFSIVNPFINSFIKKRIVMINQHPSKKSKALKITIIVPLLALFLLSFNIEPVYQNNQLEAADEYNKILEFSIDKNTSDEELLKIKTILALEKYDFSYTVVRNKVNEIESISLEVNGGNQINGEVSSRYSSASDNDSIDMIQIIVNTTTNAISIGTSKIKNKSSANDTKIWLKSGNQDHAAPTSVKNRNDKQTILITEEEKNDTVRYNNIEMDSTKFTIKKVQPNGKKKVFIYTKPSNEHDLEILEEDSNGYVQIASNADQEPIFYIDGRKASSAEMKRMNPNNIKAMYVLKGEKAVKKYGESAKYGVVEITLKKVKE